jgi:hypothetical protein
MKNEVGRERGSSGASVGTVAIEAYFQFERCVFL